jgi:hypothetical protein
MPFTSGVFPVYNIIFKIGTKGLASLVADMVSIADLETFGVKIAGKVESWTPMTTNGWARNLMTGKDFSIGLKGKRNVGDPGNDYVAAAAWKDGLDCSTKAEIDFPDGSKLEFNCAIDVTNVGGGDSTHVAPLEFDLKGDGKPTYTPAAAPAALTLSSSVPDNNAVGVATGVQPALTFNNKLASYDTIILLNETDNVIVAIMMTLDATGKILTIAPTAALLSTKVYDFILTGVTDIYGQVLAQQIIKFTIA